jgi:apolipoprotein N-acyltransferase
LHIGETSHLATDGTNTFPVADRLSYLWLVLGGILGLFTFGQWTIPLAPWLATPFFIRFMHFQKPLRGYLILSLVRMGLAAVFLGQLVPSSMFPIHVRLVVIILGSLSGILPFLADRLIAPRLKGVTAALVFPVTATAWEFITHSINPIGTFSAVAYSQYGNLPLMQLVSVTGLAGLTFLITWFGSTVNWIWERSFFWPAIRRCVALYAAVMGIVLLYGGARLAFHDSTAGTMQITSFSLDLQGEGVRQMSLLKNDRATYRQKTSGFHDRYFDETRRQADAGAQLILWPEAAGICAIEDEAALIERGRKLAREKSIYLGMSLFIQDLESDHPPENKLIVVDPAGEVVMEHFKYGGNQFEGSVLGNGVLQTFQTPSAKVGGVICWDMDFPRIMSQTGRNGTDILLAPANDWKAVSTTHAHMAVFRAIENGVSLVRQSKNGLSITTDPYGRTLARMDYFTASERVMIAQVPTTGVTTVYSVIGDLFAWMTVIGFLLLVCWVIVESRWSKRTCLI